VIDGHFILALTSGMVATVNPCGFAMLPAYLSYFLGLSAELPQRSTATSLARALIVSATLLAGFLTVFVAFGVLIRGFGVSQGDILRYAKWPGTVIGLTLIVVGVAMAFGWHLPFATPRLNSGGKTTTFGSMYLFGVSYAVTSLSCASGPFIGTVMGSFTREGFASGVYMFMLYALGMGLVVGALTVSMSVAQQGMLRVLRSAMRYTERVAGVLLIGSGTYLVYYWAFNGGEKSTPISNVQNRVDRWFAGRADATPWLVLTVLVVVVLTATVVAISSARHHSNEPRSSS
jgi:cytochrome c-type biogenesis protein